MEVIVKKPKGKEKRCPIPECWNMIPDRKAMCGACSSWWYRVSVLTAAELGGYMQRMGRFSGRLGHIRNRKGKLRAA
jgi:hypothetical protein